MPTVPLLHESAATPEQAQALRHTAASRGAVLNLFRAMAHSPHLARRVADVGAYLRYESVLPPPLREAVILALAAHWDCPYERAAHEPIARALGFSETDLADLRQARVPATLDPAAAAAVRYALHLAATGRPSADLDAAPLDPGALVELHLLVGYYSMLALFLNGLEVPIDPGS